MPTTERVKVWVVEVLTPGDLNAEFDNLVNDVNAAFDPGTGHDHDGTDSALLSYSLLTDKPNDRNAFLFPLDGTLVEGDDAAVLYHKLFEQATLVKVYCVGREAPVGLDAIFDIEYKDGANPWKSLWDVTPANRLTVTDGDTEAEQTVFDNTVIPNDSLLRVNVDQRGSTTEGADFSVYLVYQIVL